MSNNFERFQLATLRLTQDGSIKDRLIEAYDAHLSRIDAETLPDQVREEFDAVCACMHREPPQVRESPVRATVRKMSSMEACEVAASVVRLFTAMCRVEFSRATSHARPTRVPVPLMQLLAAEG